MIESSVIKLILIVILNISFVWVWVKKENLRSVMPFKIIRKVEEKVFLKNYKKIKEIISFIGNISMFWVLNISYLVLIKFFEKELNLILGFPEGMTRDGISQTNVLKSNYIYANSLDEITKFIFDTGNMPTLFVGVTALMIPIYLYIIGFKSKSKRQLLLMLTKKGDMFYISFFIYVMLFFKVEKLFLFGAIGYLIYLLMKAVKWIMKIENSLYSFEGLDKILKLQEEKEIVELYNATLNELYQGVKDNDASKTDETQKLLLLLLRNNIVNLKNTEKLIRTLYDVYDVAIKNQDDDIFHKISHLHIFIAQYYLINDEKNKFYWTLRGMGKVYDYYHKNGTDKFASRVVSGFKYDQFYLWRNYEENFEKLTSWYCEIYKAITESIKKSIENNDFYFFKEFIYLIGHEFKYKDNMKRDYKLFEKTIYFGVLLYLKEDKRKRGDDRTQYKKIHEFIEFIEKEILINISLIDLIELYEFIKTEDMFYKLNWEDYFNPKIEIVRVTNHSGRQEKKIDELFFELLGKVKLFEKDKRKLLNDEYLKIYYRIGYSSFSRITEEEKEILIERIEGFKENAEDLLFELKGKELDKKKYNEIKDFLSEMTNNFKLKKNERIKKESLSEEKYNLFKDEVKKVLASSEVIEIFKKLKKCKQINKKNNKLSEVNISEFIKKDYFVKLGKKDKKTVLDGRLDSETFGKSLNIEEERIKDLARSYGRGLNDGVEKIIVENLENSATLVEDLDATINNIGGNPWVVITGMGEYYYQYSNNENIRYKKNLEKKDYDKYGEILESVYKSEKKEIPIYKFRAIQSEETEKYISGIYIFNSGEIDSFYHYLSGDDEIEADFEDEVSYTNLKLMDTKNLSEEKKEELLSKHEMSEEEFYQNVWIILSQKGELKLKEDAKVYKVEFNG